jgi:hypothetical protein
VVARAVARVGARVRLEGVMTVAMGWVLDEEDDGLAPLLL